MAGAPALGLDPIAQESGFSGFVQPGVGYLSIKSNMVARVLSFDMSEDRIDSLNREPGSQSTPMVMLPFKLAYTFEGSRTEVFVGTEVGDLLTFDVAQQVAIKHDFGGVGVIQAGVLFTGPIVEVWKDPYVTGQDRQDTNRDSAGGQLVWDRVFGSGLELGVAMRNVSIGDEESGEFLGLSGAQQQLLDRNGIDYRAWAGYLFRSGRHLLKPEISGTYGDLDGDAMASTGGDLKLTYLYQGDPIMVILNASVGYADYDERNPVFGKTRSDNRYGLSATAYYRNPWDWRLLGSGPMRFHVSAAYLVVDSNIDFYRQEALLAMTGIALVWR